MKRVLTILLMLLWLAPVKAQQDSNFVYLRSIKGSFTYFNVDNLGNIYLLNNGNQLKKIGPNGDSAGVFNDVRRYGKLYAVDAANPLKLLLFYKNFSTTVVLDRFLNIRNTIDFRKQQLFRVKVMANAYDNNIWVFDDQEYKLKKIDETGKLLSETVDWRQLFDTLPSPTHMIDRENFVYLYDPEKGFYIFDYYGTFKNRLPFTGWKDIEVNGQTMYGFKEGKLFSYALGSLNLKTYLLPAFFGKYIAIKAINGRLYLLKKEGIDIYSIR